MIRSLSLGCALAWLLSACSSGDAPPEPAAMVGAGGNTGGTAATAGTGGTAGSATAGAATGGSASGAAGMTSGGGGSGQTTGGSAGAGGNAGAAAGAGGSPSGGSPPAGPFACSMYIGAYLSMEWWNTGQFEGKDANKVDTDTWELKWHHHAYVSEWRKASSPFWGHTGDPMDDAQGSPIQSPCTQSPEQPDRVVYLAIDWDLVTEAAWVDGLKDVVTNIKTKLPSVKRVDLVPLVRCPSAMPMCNPTADYGPGANLSAPRQDCYVPDYVDSALAKVAAADSGYVAVGPKLEMATCNPTHDGAHMTPAGNQQAAKDYAAYYLQHL